jgi:dethiobiotin synthetase
MSGRTRGFFVTGTDTGVGKTLIAAALLRGFRLAGFSVAGMKPIASGCDNTLNGLINSDATLLQQESSTPLLYSVINPYSYAPAIAPHLAARDAQHPVNLAVIAQRYSELAAGADVIIVEGAGGWLVPISDSLDMSDIATRLALPVILVVGLRLGCLNHARLSVDSIHARGASLAGWVANAIDPDFARSEDNVATLSAAIEAPCLGVVPYATHPDIGATAARLNLGALAQSTRHRT